VARRRCWLPASWCIAISTLLCHWLQHSGRVSPSLPWEERMDPGQTVPCCPGRALLPRPPVMLRFPVSSCAMSQPQKMAGLAAKHHAPFLLGAKPGRSALPPPAGKGTLSSFLWEKADLSLHRRSSGWLGLGHTGSLLHGTKSARSSAEVCTEARLDAAFRPAPEQSEVLPQPAAGTDAHC